MLVTEEDCFVGDSGGELVKSMISNVVRAFLPLDFEEAGLRRFVGVRGVCEMAVEFSAILSLCCASSGSISCESVKHVRCDSVPEANRDCLSDFHYERAGEFSLDELP